MGNDPLNLTDPSGMIACPAGGCETVRQARQEIGNDLKSDETDDFNREYGGFIYQQENGNYNYTLIEGEADYINLGSPSDLRIPHIRVVEGWHSQAGVYGEAAEYFSSQIGTDTAGNPVYDPMDGDVAWSAANGTPLSLFAPSGNISIVIPQSGFMSRTDFVPSNQPTIIMPDGSALEPAPIRGLLASPLPAGRWRD